MPPKIIFREGTTNDSSFIFNKIKELARYTDKEHMVTLTETDFAKEFSNEKKFIELLIAETDEEHSKFVGYAICIPFFNSYTGRKLYLNNLFIEQEFRGNGFGKAFFRELAKLGTRKGCIGLEWSSLPDNDVAAGFYKSIGGVDKTATEKWHKYYLPKDKFIELANS